MKKLEPMPAGDQLSNRLVGRSLALHPKKPLARAAMAASGGAEQGPRQSEEEGVAEELSRMATLALEGPGTAYNVDV